MHRKLLPLIIIVVTFSHSICLAEKFPYRQYYPEVNIIKIDALKAGFESGEYIFVDVRSPVEFSTIHMKNAVNLPYANAKFTENILLLAKKNPGKKIAVYDNGISCIKSYKAAEDGLYSGLQNVYAFDAGIKIWATTYPAYTIFNGDEMSSADELHTEDKKFKSFCLDYDSFKNKSSKGNAVVIDARDPMQRKQSLPGMEKALQIPLGKLVNNIIKKGYMKDKELMIFDQVGRQVNWLMYSLVDNGYTNFYFLDGGATSVLKVQDYR